MASVQVVQVGLVDMGFWMGSDVVGSLGRVSRFSWERELFWLRCCVDERV